MQWMGNKHESDKDEDGDSIPVKPTFVKNADMVALLKSFNKGFKAALNGLEDLYPKSCKQAMVHQHAWQQQQLSDGIKELDKCEIDHILFMYHNVNVYEKVTSLCNGSFAILVNN